MALTKEQKDKNAATPSQERTQTHEQVFYDDANPMSANLAKNAPKSGRGFDDSSREQSSAPKVQRQTPSPK